MIRHRGQKPFCACGCGRRVKLWKCRFFSHGCVPRAVRVEAGRLGRVAYARQQRIARWRIELARLRALERVTAEDLAVSFDRIAAIARHAGYHSGVKRGLQRAQEEQRKAS